MKVQPYMSFNGRCEEAIEFYRRALGAEVVMLMRYKDSPEPAMAPPGSENKVMHATIRIGESEIGASDSHCDGKLTFEGISLTLIASNEAEAQRNFKALSMVGRCKCR